MDLGLKFMNIRMQLLEAGIFFMSRFLCRGLPAVGQFLRWSISSGVLLRI